MIESWLELLCQCLPGLLRATVIRSHGGKPICVWPKNSWTTEEIKALTKLKAQEASHQRLDSSRMQFCQPLTTKNVRFGTLYLDCYVEDEQVKAIEQLLLWSQTWLELLAKLNREKSRESNRLLDVLEKSSAYDDLAKNTYAFCSHLTTQLSLKQAVFCTSFRDKVKILSVSKAPYHDSRTQPFEQLSLYLENFRKQNTDEVKAVYDEWLLRNNPDTCYEVFPVSYEDHTFGYLVIYFSATNEQLATIKDQISLFLRYLSPMYFKLYWAQLSVLKRSSERVRAFVQDKTYTQRRIIYIACAIAGVGALLMPINHQVKANAHIEGRVQRAIVVPEDGYLQEVYVKTGETIEKGQLIALLDEKSIRLDVQRWQNEKQEHEREYNRELTALNHVQMRIAQAKIAQAQAKLSIFQHRLDKTRILAPIDGVVIKGDLSRSVGAPVKQGQVLYEMAPDKDFKLVLQVAEDSVTTLEEGQSGQLQLTAFPSKKIGFDIVAISSVYEVEGHKLQYRVEAKLKDYSVDLRPGMTGIGKIKIAKEPWFFILTQPLFKKLRIWWWKLL